MREGSGDPGLYTYAPYRGRPKLTWPGGKTVAVWVSPNLEFYEIDPPANPYRKAWPRPHPDVATAIATTPIALGTGEWPRR